MQIAGIVILYHPGSEVIENINSYLQQVDKLYVADNTENELSEMAAELSKNNKVKIIQDGTNEGIAKRLNLAANLAIAEGFDWLLTMDQDSRFGKDNINFYLQCIQSYDQKADVAMFGIEYEKEPLTTNCNNTEVLQLITSGSIINLQLFKNVGGFDEALFIDDVDTDYCYNSITKGYKIIKFTNIFLNHSLGKVSNHTSLKTFTASSRTLHSPVRLYYMVRNYLYMNRKYASSIFSKEKRRRKRDLLHRIKNNFLYGKNKLTLLHFVALAWLDCNRKRMGKKL
jgi:rhamnosyltransferase